MPNYQDIRGNIKSGDMIAFSKDGLVGETIKFVTKGPFTHVGIAFVIGGRIFLLQSQEFSGTNMVLLSEQGDFYWIPTKSMWTQKAENWALSKLHSNYSYFDAFRVGFNMRPNSTGLICSLYAADILEQCGFSPFDRQGLHPNKLVMDLYQRNYKPTFINNPK